MSDVIEEADELKDDILDLKCRSMKNNLVFTGIYEKEHRGPCSKFNNKPSSY